MERQFAAAASTPNSQCPVNMQAAVFVDHTDGSTTGTNTYVNEAGVNCGTMFKISTGANRFGLSAADTPETELIRQVGEQFGDRALDRQFWNKLTLYTTTEPSPNVMSQLIAIGVREVVYGLRTGDLQELGYPLVAIRALDVMRRQPVSYGTTLTTGSTSRPAQVITSTLIGQVLATDMRAFFAWQHNETNPCPHPCEKFRGSRALGERCRLH
jgi:tRNA(Arg) A34 adenosine deaminase TadA